MNDKVVTLDVREMLRAGREPFSQIMATVAELQPEEQLRLLAPFEPVPLFKELQRQGFSHAARPIGSGDWEVLFTRATSADETVKPIAAPSPGQVKDPLPPAGILELDARGLEPPQPLVKILEALGHLPEHGELRARTDRRPMHLYPQLEERGFDATTKEESDGSFLTCICRY